MRTPISHEDTTVIMVIEDILQKEYIMSSKDIDDIRSDIKDLAKRLAWLEGKFYVVSGILGVIGVVIVNYLSDILKALGG